MEDFFAALDTHLKANSARLADTFAQYDADGSGCLSVTELAR
jgi:Ca2+-binding EF-hand superfamily protein